MQFTRTQNTTFRAACGSTVEITPKAKAHMEAHPEVANLLAEAIGKTHLNPRQFVEAEVELGRTIGQSDLIGSPRQASSSIMHFAVRKGREKPTRVIPATTIGPDTSTMVVIAKCVSNKRYHLVTSWIGRLAKKEPWDPNIRSEADFRESLEFWCTKGLAYNPETMGPIYESTWDIELQKNRTDQISKLIG